MPPSSLLDRAHELEVEIPHKADCKLSVASPAAVEAAPIAVVAPVPVVTRGVHFADADVIEFEPTVWTATVSSDGAPVGLSNKVRRRTRRRLDSWEDERAPCRVLREDYMENGYLEPEERLDILEAAGHAISTVHHVEHDTVRINRERWESNEHDLRYQYGLGEVFDLDAEEDEDDRFLRGFVPDDEVDDAVDFDDDDEEMLDNEEDAESLHSYYYGHTALLSDEEDDMRVAMDAMESYGTRKFDEWAWDYSTDAMLSDNDQRDDNEDNQDTDSQVPFPEDLFDLHDLDDDGDFAEMSMSPSDISATSECGLAARFEVPMTKSVKENVDLDPATESTISSAPYAIV